MVSVGPPSRSYRYIGPKLRYALNETESFPDDDGTVTRQQPFRFLALVKAVARRWRYSSANYCL